ncbi:hypothetical protein FHW69_003556 [Luteibacter sp. Sphag1AF]|uniref:hypothetical protein n=1 Tax=Luteibacter sp. Sphag1AF TaxID=2587031 RepID=UPI001609C947|nr:hypothetical protein [Luteibacter sp. Sphag1AF]MBB3228908.1 hypothetical protein [Luteibacter sp. Sphag1AF]
MNGLTRFALGFCVLGLTGLASAKPPVDADAAALCKGVTPCEVRDVKPAGRSEAGKDMKVVRLWLGESVGKGDNLQKCGDYDDGDEHGHMQFWLLGGRDGKRKLLDLCNDGYGAAGVGQDTVEVKPNLFIHTQNGGSAWRWGNSANVKLDPLTVLSEESSSYWNMGENNSNMAWDWTTFTGKADWFVPTCNAAGEAPEPQSVGGGDVSYPYKPIPRMESADLPGGAAQAMLGTCSVQVGADGKGGFLLRGKDQPASSAWMRVLGVGKDELMVTVGGADWTHGASNWIFDDHLELWFAPEPSSTCMSSDAVLSQWAVGIADGTLRQGYKAKPETGPKLLSRTTGADHAVTYRFKLPADLYSTNSISVVLSLGNGTKQLRMVGTSPVKLGKATTMGGFFDVAAGGARCEVEGGQLNRKASGLPVLLDERSYSQP